MLYPAVGSASIHVALRSTFPKTFFCHYSANERDIQGENGGLYILPFPMGMQREKMSAEMFGESFFADFMDSFSVQSCILQMKTI